MGAEEVNVTPITFFTVLLQQATTILPQRMQYLYSGGRCLRINFWEAHLLLEFAQLHPCLSLHTNSYNRGDCTSIQSCVDDHQHFITKCSENITSAPTLL